MIHHNWDNLRKFSNRDLSYYMSTQLSMFMSPFITHLDDLVLDFEILFSNGSKTRNKILKIQLGAEYDSNQSIGHKEVNERNSEVSRSTKSGDGSEEKRLGNSGKHRIGRPLFEKKDVRYRFETTAHEGLKIVSDKKVVDDSSND